jgi:hypothetical protein
LILSVVFSYITIQDNNKLTVISNTSKYYISCMLMLFCNSLKYKNRENSTRSRQASSSWRAILGQIGLQRPGVEDLWVQREILHVAGDYGEAVVIERQDKPCEVRRYPGQFIV